MADQMPLERKVGERLDFRQRFLDAVFAERDVTGRDGRANVLGRDRLGHRDQGDFGRRTAGAMRRRIDAAAHGLELCRDAGHALGGRHRYGVSMIAFAVAAFGPVGASFKYSPSDFFASATLPSLMSTMPSR